jgi:hypothetical protein
VRIAGFFVGLAAGHQWIGPLSQSRRGPLDAVVSLRSGYRDVILSLTADARKGAAVAKHHLFAAVFLITSGIATDYSFAAAQICTDRLVHCQNSCFDRCRKSCVACFDNCNTNYNACLTRTGTSWPTTRKGPVGDGGSGGKTGGGNKTGGGVIGPPSTSGNNAGPSGGGTTTIYRGRH